MSERMHWADKLAGRVFSRTKMFSGGFGDAETLEAMAAQGDLFSAHIPGPDLSPLLRPRRVDPKAPATRELRWESEAIDARYPESVRTARALFLSPDGQLRPERPLVLAMSASGEEGYARRQKLLLPLVRRGLEALILENPFYGARRAPGQTSSRLETVYDQFHMNHASVLEALALLRGVRALGGAFADKDLGLLGYSMGGYMVALAASAFEGPLFVVPVAAGRSPRSVYLDGALSWSVDFARLEGERDDAREFLAYLFEATTDYLRPLPPQSRSILVSAEGDGFVFPRETQRLHALWSRASMRVYRGGHTHVFTTFDGHVRRALSSLLDP